MAQLQLQLQALLRILVIAWCLSAIAYGDVGIYIINNTGSDFSFTCSEAGHQDSQTLADGVQYELGFDTAWTEEVACTVSWMGATHQFDAYNGDISNGFGSSFYWYIKPDGGYMQCDCDCDVTCAMSALGKRWSW